MRNEQFLISTKWGRKIRNFETNLQLLRRGGVEKGLTIGPKFSARMRAQLQEIILFNKSNRTKLKELQKWRNYLHDLMGEVRKRQGLANRRALRRNPIAVTESGLGPRSQLPTDLLAETAEFIKNLEERVAEGIQYAEDNIHGKEGRLRSEPSAESPPEEDPAPTKADVDAVQLPQEVQDKLDFTAYDDESDQLERIPREIRALHFVLQEKKYNPKELNDLSDDDIVRILMNRVEIGRTALLDEEYFNVREDIEKVTGEVEPSLKIGSAAANKFWRRYFKVLGVISPPGSVPADRIPPPPTPLPPARPPHSLPDILAPLRDPRRSPPPLRPPAAPGRERAAVRPDVQSEELEKIRQLLDQTQQDVAELRALRIAGRDLRRGGTLNELIQRGDELILKLAAALPKDGES